MNQEGPNLETLLRRLAETPAEFLAEPRIGNSGTVPVAAVVSDLLRDLGGPALTPARVRRFQPADRKKDLNRLRVVLVSCWLAADAWFKQQAASLKPGELAVAALQFLDTGVDELASMTPADKFVTDPDRREEMVRLYLKDLGLRPAGETVPQAQDRLNTLSSVERARVIRAARQAEQRAQAIREEMRRKMQAEAQAKAMRE
jgi:hypothetical protein